MNAVSTRTTVVKAMVTLDIEHVKFHFTVEQKCREIGLSLCFSVSHSCAYEWKSVELLEILTQRSGRLDVSSAGFFIENVLCDAAVIKVQLKPCFIVVSIHFTGSVFRDGDKHLDDNLK